MIKRLFKNFTKIDKPLLIVSVIFVVFGLLNIVTASSRETIDSEVFLYHFFIKQLTAIGVGTFTGIIIINMNLNKSKTLYWLAYFSLVFLTVALILFGKDVRGAALWINLGFFSLQPTELLKPVVILVLAFLFDTFYKEIIKSNNKNGRILGLILGIGVIPAVLIFTQRDLGTMLVFLFIFIVMFLSSPINLKDKFFMVIVGISFMIIGILALLAFNDGKIFTKSQEARFNYKDPCLKYEGDGYQVCNGLIAINDGGLFGVGIGKSRQKYSYIPEPHTDSIFVITIEEYGLLRVGIIFISYIFLLFQILFIGSKSKTIYGKYICIGVASLFFIHIFINLGGMFALIPLTGLPLPFLSYGGSFAIATVICLALVQRVAIENKLTIIKKKNVKK